MKAIAIIVIVSLCLGGLSYESAQSLFESKIVLDVTTAINSVTGLLGLGSDFRTAGHIGFNSSTLFQNDLTGGEYVNLVDFVTMRQTVAYGSTSELNHPPQPLDIVSISDEIYEYQTDYTTEDGKTYRVTFPCIDAVVGKDECIIVDPCLYYTAEFGYPYWLATVTIPSIGTLFYVRNKTNVFYVEGSVFLPYYIYSDIESDGFMDRKNAIYDYGLLKRTNINVYDYLSNPSIYTQKSPVLIKEN